MARKKAARKKITISEESGEKLRELMESRELSIGDTADLAIKVGFNRLSTLDRHKKKKRSRKKE